MDQQDKDQIINWERIEEPGENPQWNSRVGIVEQVSWGENPQYVGYVKEKKETPDFTTHSFSTIKKSIEEAYIKQYGRPRFAWEREVCDIVIDKMRRKKSSRELIKDAKVVSITSAQTFGPYSSDTSSQHSEAEYPPQESDCDW